MDAISQEEGARLLGQSKQKPDDLEDLFYRKWMDAQPTLAPKRQFRFHSSRRWVFDFCWPPPYMVAVEIDGGTWSGGRHVRGSGYAKDCEKLNAATCCGFRILRYTGDDIKKRLPDVIEQVHSLLMRSDK